MPPAAARSSLLFLMVRRFVLATVSGNFFIGLERGQIQAGERSQCVLKH
jgi:hypothetical protein